MNIDELKGLKLRKTMLEAELARINAELDMYVPPMPKRHNEVANQRSPGGYPANREQFYKDAENDFRNVDSNGNYE